MIKALINEIPKIIMVALFKFFNVEKIVFRKIDYTFSTYDHHPL